MKVREVMEQLKNIDPEREVVLSSDAEGNNYRMLYGLDSDMFYQTEEGWVFDEQERVDEDYPLKDCIKAVVLWPYD